jgi:hypothetical protein
MELQGAQPLLNPDHKGKGKQMELQGEQPLLNSDNKGKRSRWNIKGGDFATLFPKVIYVLFTPDFILIFGPTFF